MSENNALLNYNYNFIVHFKKLRKNYSMSKCKDSIIFSIFVYYTWLGRRWHTINPSKIVLKVLYYVSSSTFICKCWGRCASSPAPFEYLIPILAYHFRTIVVPVLLSIPHLIWRREENSEEKRERKHIIYKILTICFIPSKSTKL